jgi:ribonuclease HI
LLVCLCQETLEANYSSTEINVTWPTSPKKVQKEWSCALCLVSTTSEKCLETHLQGKKHMAKKEELRMEKLIKSNGMVFVQMNLEKLSDLLSPVAGSIRWCRWQKPKFGWTKLNTDGSVDRENAGFGGLLRDYKGVPICAFVSKAPCDDIFLVELWAVWRGLVLALGLGIKVIWVESDSLSVVKTINKKQPFSPKAASCVYHIWELLKKFEKYKISHSWRETNRAADHLSKMAVLGSDMVFWPTNFPKSLGKIIKDDAEGKIYCRR